MSLYKAIAGSFVGKIAATIFILVLAALGLGPEKWVAPLLGVSQESWLLVARAGLILLSLFVFLIVLAVPYLSQHGWVFAWRYDLDSKSWLPFRRVIKIQEAARRCYEEMRLMGARVVSGNAALDHFGQYLAQNAQLFGTHPPSTLREAIPQLEAKRMQVQGDATELASIDNEESKFVGLEIMARDFRRVLRKLKNDLRDTVEKANAGNQREEKPETYVVFDSDGEIVDRSNVGIIIKDDSNTDEQGFNMFCFQFIKKLPKAYDVNGGDGFAWKIVEQRPDLCALMVKFSPEIISHGNSVIAIEPHPSDMKIVFEVRE